MFLGLQPSAGVVGLVPTRPAQSALKPGFSHLLCFQQRAAALRPASPPRPPRPLPQQSLCLSQGNCVPATPEPLTGSRCPARGEWGLRRPASPLRSVNTSHVSPSLQQAALGHPQKPLAPGFPNRPGFTFLGRPCSPQRGPRDPQEPGESCPPVPGTACPQPGTLPGTGSDDVAFELSQPPLPGAPCAFPTASAWLPALCPQVPCSPGTLGYRCLRHLP